jgi:hypothetical protein
VVFANTHYGTGDERMRQAPSESIEAELRERLQELEKEPASCSRPSACGCGPSTTSRCWPRPGCAAGGELQPPPRRPGAGGGPLHPARLLPQGLPGGDRREPRGRAPAAGPVRRRPVPQGDPGRPRLPPALGPGQPAPPLRGVHRAGAGQASCLGHAGGVGARAQRPGGGAGDPADRPGRPRGDIVPTTGQIDDLRPGSTATVAAAAGCW